jgi:hypothetical protein
MNFALIIYTVVGTLSPTLYTNVHVLKDWRVLTTHPTSSSCFETAVLLKLPANSHRCLELKTGKIVP